MTDAKQPLTPPDDQSFPRAARLTRAAEFEAVLARGRHVGGQLTTLSILVTSAGRSRLGLIVSRKVGSAVIRNRLRRRLREVFRRSLRQALEEEDQRTVDVVIRVRPQAGRTTWVILHGELLASAQRWLRGQRPRPAGGGQCERS